MPITRRSIPLAFAVTLLASCLAPRRDPAPAPLTDAQRAHLRALGGDELVADADRLDTPLGRDRRNHEAAACLDEYVTGLVYTERGDARADRQFHDCAYTCRTLADRPAAALRDLGARYAPRCAAKNDRVLGGDALAYAAKKTTALEGERGALNLYYRRAEARGALTSAREKLGDTPEVAAIEARIAEVERAHRDPLARATAFMSRADIVELLRQQRELEDMIQAMEHDYGVSPELETARLKLEHLKGELRGVDARWDFEVRQAAL